MSDKRLSGAQLARAALPSEEALCSAFIQKVNTFAGWTCHPETGGFDVLVVHDDGRQIGVEAKLQLNAKVIDQVLPSPTDSRFAKVGPDHRMVIVRTLTEASNGLAKMLDYLGVTVVAPWIGYRQSRDRRLELTADFNDLDYLFSKEKLTPPRSYGYESLRLHDWNPESRLPVSSVAPDLPAGVKSPVRMTAWKLCALHVLARLELQGRISAKQIQKTGCNPTIWTRQWLTRSEDQGFWVAGENMPDLPRQFPEQYAIAIDAMRETLTKENG